MHVGRDSTDLVQVATQRRVLAFRLLALSLRQGHKSV